jgi:hypothetical protein
MEIMFGMFMGPALYFLFVIYDELKLIRKALENK